MNKENRITITVEHAGESITRHYYFSTPQDFSNRERWGEIVESMADTLLDTSMPF